MNQTLIVIDGDNLAWRSHWALPNLKFGGCQTGATFGFLTEMIRVADRFNTQEFAFCFDIGQPKRVDLYPGYKDHLKRNCNPADYKSVKQQLQKIREEFLPVVGYKNIFMQEGYEADDLIASVCKHTDKDCLIISGDKDLYQLISDRVGVYISAAQATRFGRSQVLDLQGFYQHYGILPEQWAMVKAIAGCRGDLVKGIRGVGEKSAIKYLKDELKPGNQYRTKIEAGSFTIQRNMNLVQLPYPGTMECHTQEQEEVNRHKWNLMVKRYGIDTLKDKLPIPHTLERVLFDG